MADFKNKIEETRKQLKTLLDSEGISKDTIEKISAIDKSLDSVVEEHSKTEKDLMEIKDSYVDYIKNNSSKAQIHEEFGDDKNENLNVDDNFNELLGIYLDNRKRK